MKKFLLVMALCFFPAFSAPSLQDPTDNAAWWITNYGVVTASQDPLVGRSRKVFQRVLAAADKKANRIPQLVVIKTHTDPYAEAIPDGSIILSLKGIKTCYTGVKPDAGDSRLAFVLGHELSHLAKDDFWHQKAFAAVQAYRKDSKADEAIQKLFRSTTDAGSRNTNTVEERQMKELQADAYGILYATLAGYNPLVVFQPNHGSFFDQWTSAVDPEHPSKQQRAEFLRIQIASIAEDVELFHWGVRFYQLGYFEDAIHLLKSFAEKFPSREVFNNLGLSHYQSAMKLWSGCDLSSVAHFRLSTALDPATLAEKTLLMRGEENPCSPFQEAIHRQIQLAITSFKQGSDMDPDYIPIRLNLASAWIMKGEYSQALGILDEAIQEQSHDSGLLNNKAVALYLFGQANNIDTAAQAVEILEGVIQTNPSMTDAFYNIAAMESERGHRAASRESCEAFLKLEQTGGYARLVRKQLGIPEPESRSVIKDPPIVSPILIGRLDQKSKTILRGFKQRHFTMGGFEADVFSGKDFSALVVGDNIELVESRLVKSLDWTNIQKKYGPPIRVVDHLSGSFFIYKSFALDTFDGKVTHVVYFKK